MSLAGQALLTKARSVERALNRSGAKMTDRELALLEVALEVALQLVRVYRKTRG